MRPPRVATACLFIGLSCTITLLFLGSWLSDWGSIEVQKQVRDVFHVTDVMSWLREALLAAAAVSAAGIVFAIYAFMGHQPSRIILTVFAGLTSLMFLAEGLFGILPAVFSIGCGIYLWTPEARQWFAIKNGKMAPPPPAPRPDPFSVPVPPPMVDAGLQRSAAVAPAILQATRPAAERPQTVLAAGLIAIIMSALVAFVCGVNALFYLVDKKAYVGLFRDNEMLKDRVKQMGMSPTELADTLFLVCSVMAAASALALIAAAFVLAGNVLASKLLVILAVPSAAVSIVILPFGPLWTGAAIATIILLRRPQSRQFFDRS